MRTIYLKIKKDKLYCDNLIERIKIVTERIFINTEYNKFYIAKTGWTNDDFANDFFRVKIEARLI